MQNDKTEIGFYFTHRTFAEYFAAKFLTSRLKKRGFEKPALSFLNKFFLSPEFMVVKSFMDMMMWGTDILKQLNKNIDKFLMPIERLGKVDPIGRNLLHMACDKENSVAIRWLLDNNVKPDQLDKLGKPPFFYMALSRNCGKPVTRDFDDSHHIFIKPMIHLPDPLPTSIFNSSVAASSNYLKMINSTTKDGESALRISMSKYKEKDEKNKSFSSGNPDEDLRFCVELILSGADVSVLDEKEKEILLSYCFEIKGSKIWDRYNLPAEALLSLQVSNLYSDNTYKVTKRMCFYLYGGHIGIFLKILKSTSKEIWKGMLETKSVANPLNFFDEGINDNFGHFLDEAEWQEMLNELIQKSDECGAHLKPHSMRQFLENNLLLTVCRFGRFEEFKILEAMYLTESEKKKDFVLRLFRAAAKSHNNEIAMYIFNRFPKNKLLEDALSAHFPIVEKLLESGATSKQPLLKTALFDCFETFPHVQINQLKNIIKVSDKIPIIPMDYITMALQYCNFEVAKYLMQFNLFREQVKEGSFTRKLIEFTRSSKNVSEFFVPTDLHKAVKERVIGIPRLLLSTGYDPNALDAEGKPPLFYAKNDDSINTLLEFGAFFNHPTISVKSNFIVPFISSCFMDDVGDKSAYHKDDVRDNYVPVLNGRHYSLGYTLLHEITILEEIDRIHNFLNDPKFPITKVNFSSKDKDGNTPLHYSALLDQQEMVKYFLRAGARFDLKNELGHRPVDMNPNSNSAEILNYVSTFWAEFKNGKFTTDCLNKIFEDLDNEFILFSRNSKGQTLLHICARSKKIENSLVKRLIRFGLPLDIRDDSGKTAFDFAMSSDEMVKYLLKCGAFFEPEIEFERPSPNICNSNKYLNLCAKLFKEIYREEWKAVIDFLEEDPKASKVVVNVKDRYGNCMLHYAAYHNNSEAVKCLINLGAWWDIYNSKFKSPAEYAKHQDTKKIFFILARTFDHEEFKRWELGFIIREMGRENPGLLKNARNHLKKSLLHEFATDEHINTVKYLVNEIKCNVNVKDFKGKTPKDYCLESEPIVAAFLSEQ